MMNIDTCSLLYVTKVREKVNDVFNNVVVIYYGVCSLILILSNVLFLLLFKTCRKNILGWVWGMTSMYMYYVFIIFLIVYLRILYCSVLLLNFPVHFGLNSLLCY